MLWSFELDFFPTLIAFEVTLNIIFFAPGADIKIKLPNSATPLFTLAELNPETDAPWEIEFILIELELSGTVWSSKSIIESVRIFSNLIPLGTPS